MKYITIIYDYRSELSMILVIYSRKILDMTNKLLDNYEYY
jgi:hypothetical protein